jgi:hypothetical protein
MTPTPRHLRRPTLARRRGLSIVEVLISLAITSLLLTATMVATDASFMAYASAAEQASAQAATRMVTHRLITMIRTSTAHGPLEADAAANPAVTLSGDTVTSWFIELVDEDGNIVRVEHRAQSDELWMIQTPAAGGTAIAQPLLGGVTNAQFLLKRRLNSQGILVLERATLDLTVLPGGDTTLAIENRTTDAIRVITSTMPRRIEP